MMKNDRKIIWGVLPFATVFVFCIAQMALSDQIGNLHKFVGGQKAKADEVNGNFESIRSVINGHLDEGNLESYCIGTNELKSNAVTSSKIAEGAVGSYELAESVFFGKSGSYGSVSVRTSGNKNKIISGISSDGGAIWVYQKGNSDNDISVYMGVPGTGDGGLVSVSNSAGSPVVQLQPDGDVWKTGNCAFVHPHPQNPNRQIVYMALEGGERGTYFRGTAKLVNGVAEILPPENWILVSSEEGMTVQVTPRGDCAGLYVEKAARDGIVVRECGRGTSDVSFDYFVNGLRAGFEDHKVYEPNTMFLPTKAFWPRDLTPGVAEALRSNGILYSNGEVNRDLVESIRKLHALEPNMVPAIPDHTK